VQARRSRARSEPQASEVIQSPDVLAFSGAQRAAAQARRSRARSEPQASEVIQSPAAHAFSGSPAGFTLLEVLAAIAVLALVYTALARAAMQGLAHEGDASRRLQASLIADQVLGEIEAQLAAGVAPPAGRTETEQEDFGVSVEVRPFDLGAFALAAAENAAAERGAPSVGQAPQPTGGPALQLLTAPAGAPSPLFEVDVRVRWLEGQEEQEVSRTSFGADPATVAAALGELGPGDAAGEDAGADDAGAAPAPAGTPGAGGFDESEGEAP
jgi:prepilin-type N-terminal cleavage/methylation domain-containing protein